MPAKTRKWSDAIFKGNLYLHQRPPPLMDCIGKVIIPGLQQAFWRGWGCSKKKALNACVIQGCK